MPTKKGQTFNRYSEETKKEAVRLRTEEGWTYSQIIEKFGLRRRVRLSHRFVKAKTERALRITVDVGQRSILVVQW